MIDLKVATPTKKVFDGTCAKVKIKSTAGAIVILPHHAPLVTTIKDGYISIDNKPNIMIKSGFVAVGENSHVDILISEEG